MNEEIANKEAMEAIAEFANICYNKGVKDALISVCMGAGLVVAGYGVAALYEIWKDKRQLKKIENHRKLNLKKES